MQADAAVRRAHPFATTLAPRGDDAVDRGRIEPGSVGEDDDRGLDVRAERREAAAQRGTGAALPLGAADCPRIGVDVMGAEDDDDVVDRAAAEPFEDTWEELTLLRRAEACRRPGREHDCRDHAVS